ncbi:MAG: hypothetical protein MPW14_25475 (plasmid) [Candidatus Manganitrophus sp.]|nr:hypothetical protein [Candidatus Manganitrophus sp.]MDC4228376.1 hypothetical protein [Candidatus Manganitrophus sp.]WDT73669.1 MAG: hypothetical protein MPW17_22275 [Candidatus Manganitrophus sp.]WDT77827.1 MAG: hypothetical protein MPW16_21615 [Candidatus Manganitrophus sp.]WDT82742.1 MAG: hypothetical protein MPW14_25475 [Candidatus Manganitrophus sp.]
MDEMVDPEGGLTTDLRFPDPLLQPTEMANKRDKAKLKFKKFL